jgi:hypothetical protein
MKNNYTFSNARRVRMTGAAAGDQPPAARPPRVTKRRPEIRKALPEANPLRGNPVMTCLTLRSRLRRCCVSAIALAGLALSLAAPAAEPCQTNAPVWLTLTITAGALAPGMDRDTVVRLHANGCAVVRRPAYLRGAGDYRVALDAAAMKSLRGSATAESLRRFDAKQVRLELSTLQKSGNAQQPSDRSGLFFVLDADRYELRWQEGTAEGSASWDGLPDYAKAYPEVAALQAFAEVAASLQAIAQRSDAVRVTQVQP